MWSHIKCFTNETIYCLIFYFKKGGCGKWVGIRMEQVWPCTDNSWLVVHIHFTILSSFVHA